MQGTLGSATELALRQQFVQAALGRGSGSRSDSYWLELDDLGEEEVESEDGGPGLVVADVPVWIERVVTRQAVVELRLSEFAVQAAGKVSVACRISKLEQGSDGVDVLPVFTGAFCAVAQAWMLPPILVRLPARRPALARNGQAALA